MEKYHIGVVIPFYQREPGILVRSILSIVNQKVEDTFFTIVIVDDESPISAESEIASIALPAHCRIELIKQENAGPAGARNRALDYIKSQAIPIVAFIDSDDIWSDDHIKEAIVALDQGADFFFCDHSRFNSDRSWFEALGSFADWDKTVKEFDISIDGNFASLTGKNCFRLFINDYLSQTSSIVYRFENHSERRFDTSFVSAGEDFLLWLQLVGECDKVTFSLNRGLHCGEGVNIYFDSFDWNKRAASSQQGYEYLLYHRILTDFNLDNNQQTYIKSTTAMLRNRYCYLMFKHFLQGKGIDSTLFNKVFKATPIIACSIPLIFAGCVMNKKLLQIQ